MIRGKQKPGPGASKPSDAEWEDALRVERDAWCSLDQALRATARRADGTGVYVIDPRGGQEFRTYTQILENALRMGAALRVQGVGRGDRVMLLQSTGFDFLAAFFGAQAIGAVPMPFMPPRAEPRHRHLAHQRAFHRYARRLSVSAIVADRDVEPEILSPPDAPGRLVFCGQVNALLDGMPGGAVVEEQARPNELAYIQLTAGATGQMRGVELTQRNILSNVHAIGRALAVTPSDVGVSWVPPYNSMGLVGIVCFGLYWGLDMVMIHPERFMQRPEEWLAAISRHRGTLSTAPNFGYHYAVRRCQESNLKGLDLSSWRVAMNGAEPVRAQHMDAFERRFSQYGLGRDIFLPVYGLAEATLGATFGELNAPVRLDGINRRVLETQGLARPLPAEGASCPAERLHLVSVGRPLEAVALKIMDDDGVELAERECGEIWLKGPNCARGYVAPEDPSAPDQRTGTRLIGDWLATGDLGYLADGELYIVGRACDTIETARGRMLLPDEVELFVNSVDGIRVGSAVAFSVPTKSDENAANLLVVAYELQAGTAALEVERAVRSLLRKHMGIDPHAISALAPDSVPKTHSGKVRRFLARQLYLDGRLDRRERSGDLDLARRVLFRTQAEVSRLRRQLLHRVGKWLSR